MQPFSNYSVQIGRLAPIILSFLFCTSVSLHAQAQSKKVVEVGQVSQPIKTQAERDAAKQLKQKLTNLASFEANFTQVVTSVNNDILQQAQGEIALKQPNKMFWKLAEPNESILIADGQTLWHVDPFVEQVVALEQKQSIENNPLILLTNAKSDAWEKFKVTQNENVFTINAIQTDAAIVKLILRFEKELLIELKTQDSQQQLSQLIFSDIKQNQTIDDAKFEFVLPEGYDLDDQRKQ